jgi:hypothetical protein
MQEEYYEEAQISSVGISLKELLEYYRILCEQ